MNLLCAIGWHRWKEERVLEKVHPITGTRIWLDEDVCQRCEAIRNPENVVSVYSMLVMTGPGETKLHPSVAVLERNDAPK